MINTYHSSVASLPPPPPLPRQSQVFIQPRAPSAGHSKTLFRSLLAVVVLHFLLTAGGFAFLYCTGRMEKPPLPKATFQQTSSRTFARMVVANRIHSPARESTRKRRNPSCLLFSQFDSLVFMMLTFGVLKQTHEAFTELLLKLNSIQVDTIYQLGRADAVPPAGYLQWDMKHSVRSNVNYYRSSWLTVLEPGDYVVFSRVTFSRADPQRPLASAVKLKRGESSKETVAMTAYCSLDGSGSGSGFGSVPRLCTASLGEVMTLERGNQLSLWVQDQSLVDYSEAATSFGIYKL
ncbi:uncharacterized protein LOC133509029 [Syngnathoides biaculeatus]|uniref:uncharacterized protein LOC133509029 n=1 Tax=Syngnathoides biaculeatus TaxID=300417 RepID=UPI002ADD4428|nr:uncharacterized protein LOC133509029 [Syngnathoides biaculeatus]